MVKNRQVALFIAARLALNTSYRMVYPFLSAFGRGMGVDLEALSLVVTLRSFTGLVGLLVAPLADRRGRRVSMLLGLGLFTLAWLLMVIFPTFAAFCVALPLAAMGNYIFLPAMQAYLGDAVVYERRGLILAITELSWSLAFIAGVPLVGLLIAGGGWTAPFPVFAVLGGLALVLVARVLPRTPPPPQANGQMWSGFKLVLATPAARGVLLMCLLLTAANEEVNLLFGVYLENSFGLQLAALGAASAVIGIAELGGEVISGGIVDRLGKERSIFAGIVANGLAALALPWLGASLEGALLGLFLFYITSEYTYVCVLPLISEILPGARATLMAANVGAFSIGRTLGAFLAPQAYAFGFGANAALALGLNLLALGMLVYVSRKKTVG